jgi:hypothetical protein
VITSGVSIFCPAVGWWSEKTETSAAAWTYIAMIRIQLRRLA